MGEVRIFISYAREDQARVKELYHRLVAYGFAPWLDREHIIPGMRWEPVIKKALKQSDFVLVCLSASSINKRGFLQREIKQALEQAEEKLEHDVYLIPARLDDCDVPEVLSDIQWVDLFEEEGWQWLFKAIEYGLGQRGKKMPRPVSSDSPTDVGEDQRQQEDIRQRELDAQRQREAQQQAEAARLAEQKRKQEERQQEEQRLQEQARQRELEAERQRQLAAQRQREQEAQCQRALDDQRRRAEVARPPVSSQPERPRKELKTQLLTGVPARSRRVAVAVGGALVLTVLIGWLVWHNSNPTGQSGQNGRAMVTPSLLAGSSPTVTPVPVPASAEVLRYRQDSKSGRFRFGFTAQKDGYLYLVGRDKAGALFPLLTNRLGAPTNHLRAGAEFIFPARPANPLKLTEEKATFTLIFSERQLTQPDFVSASDARDLSVTEQRSLADWQNKAKTERTPIDRDGRITALPSDKTPLAVEVIAVRSASPASSR